MTCSYSPGPQLPWAPSGPPSALGSFKPTWAFVAKANPVRCPLCPAAPHLISALSWRSSRLRFRGTSSLSTTPARHRPSVGKKGGRSGAPPPKSLVFLEFRQSPGHNHGVGRKASKAGEPLPGQFL